MPNTYTFSLSTNFNNQLRNEQFHTNIINNVNITKTLLSVDTFGDNVNIIFNEALTSPEETVLNNLVSSYSYSSIQTIDKQWFFPFWASTSVNYITRNSTTNIFVANFQYQGSTSAGSFNKLTVVGGVSGSVTGYIDLIDSSLNIISTVSWNTGTATSPISTTTTTFNNVPTSSNVMGLRFRTSNNGTNKAFLHSILISC